MEWFNKIGRTLGSEVDEIINSRLERSISSNVAKQHSLPKKSASRPYEISASKTYDIIQLPVSIKAEHKDEQKRRIIFGRNGFSTYSTKSKSKPAAITSKD